MQGREVVTDGDGLRVYVSETNPGRGWWSGQSRGRFEPIYDRSSSGIERTHLYPSTAFIALIDRAFEGRRR